MSQPIVELARQAAQARKAKDWPRAREILEALVCERGARKDWFDLARARLQTGEPERALEALSEAEAKGADEASAKLRARILDRAGRPEDAAAAAEAAMAAAPDDAQAAILHLKALDKAGDERRFQIAEELLEARPDSLELHEIILDRIADPISRADLRARTIASLERIAERAETPLPAITRLCAVTVKAGDYDGLERWATAGKAAAPDDVRFTRWLDKAAAMRGAGLATLTKSDEADEAMDDEGGSVSSLDDSRRGARRYSAAVARIDSGELDAGIEALESLLADIRRNEKCAPGNIRKRLPGFLDAMRAARDMSPADAAIAPAAFETIFERPVIREKPGAKTLLVVFSAGLTRRAAWSRFFSGFDMHQVYVDDPKRVGGLRGLPGLGADPAESARALKALQAELGAERAIYYGFSIGGFSALLHAAKAGADAAVAASPPSVGDPRAMNETERRIDRRAWAVTPRYQRDLPLKDGQRAHPDGDLADIYHEGAATPPASVFYNVGRKEDRMHAERIGASGKVTLHPIPGEDGHWSDLAAIASGEMKSLFEALLAAKR